MSLVFLHWDSLQGLSEELPVCVYSSRPPQTLNPELEFQASSGFTVAPARDQSPHHLEKQTKTSGYICVKGGAWAVAPTKTINHDQETVKHHVSLASYRIQDFEHEVAKRN